jgi:adenosylcobinamide-phosphate synthase
VAYWLSAHLLRSWGAPRNELSRLADQPDVEAMAGDMGNIADDAHGRIASQAFRWVDWLPVRVTAAIFAVVGNFEDAIGLWRSRVVAAPESSDDTERVLIASGSGAMGIELSLPDAPSGAEGLDDVEGALSVSSSAGPSLREPDGLAMASAIGLVWRAVLVWFFMVLLFSLGRWLA